MQLPALDLGVVPAQYVYLGRRDPLALQFVLRVGEVIQLFGDVIISFHGAPRQQSTVCLMGWLSMSTADEHSPLCLLELNQPF